MPVGTLVYEKPADPSGEPMLIGDLVAAGQRLLLAQGGHGGRGNARFVSSTNRAPRRCEEGLPGETRQLQLHLKLLADVGLVGFPNAGKSTMIARISAARPKIADYPFTTLSPNLGVVSLSDNRSFVVADVPGLIEGAHQGHGLGDRFLKHLDRTKLLVHLVDVSGASARDPVEDFEAVQRELSFFSAELGSKAQIVAATKMDALSDPALVGRLEQHVAALGLPFARVSAVSGEGMAALLEAMWKYLAPGTSPDLIERQTADSAGADVIDLRSGAGRRGAIGSGADLRQGRRSARRNADAAGEPDAPPGW